MKKTFIALLSLVLLLSYGVTAYAQTSTQPGETAITIVDWTEDRPGQHTEATGITGIGGHAAIPVLHVQAVIAPVNVETITQNGVLFIRKTYEVAPGFDPQTLVQPFEQDGYSFDAIEILGAEQPGEMLTRPATKIASTVSDTDKEADILPHFPAIIDFEEDGYIGQLHLDGSTFKTEADRHESYTYSTNKQREIPGLDRNDPALIDREWNGMALSGVTFAQGRDGRYTATATYKGTARGERATGFVTTATYRGEISKTVPGNILYTVVYEGIPIMPPTVLPTGEDIEPEETVEAGPDIEIPQQESNPPNANGITVLQIALIGFVCLLGGIFGPKLLRVVRKKREETE